MLKNAQKDFIQRHIGPSVDEQNVMLKELGYKSLDDLIKDTVPEKILLKDDLDIGDPNSEYKALRKLKDISKKWSLDKKFNPKMKNNNIILYAAILVFGLAAPFIFPAFKVQLSILCVLIVLALTWNIQGGEMGYNTFGNILFYGLGMYLCASVQVGMFFPLAEWT